MHSPSADTPLARQLRATRLAFTRPAPGLRSSAPIAACDDLHLARGLALRATDELLNPGELLPSLVAENGAPTDPLTAARTATRSAAATLLDRPTLRRSPRLRAATDAESRHVRALVAIAVADGHGQHTPIGYALQGVRYLTEAIVSLADGDTCTAAASTQVAQIFLGRVSR
ncbi:MAG: hypothetical protein Q7T55_06540 [Solirubrobacteraceae bacterium]|nr:hypothetical protein [Solirubrobacteraceae bacterium]